MLWLIRLLYFNSFIYVLVSFCYLYVSDDRLLSCHNILSDSKLWYLQSQFSFAGSVGDAQWIIPLTLSFGSYDVRKSFLLESKIQKLDASEFLCQPESYELNKKSNDEKFWIKANVEQTGFYRVKYDDILSARLRTAIEGNCLSPTDRFGKFASETCHFPFIVNLISSL